MATVRRGIGATILGILASFTLTISAIAADGDAAAGEGTFRSKCQTCHAVDPAKGHGIGPNLHGVFGRTAGTAEGFKFSKAHADSGLTWDEATLDAYVADFNGIVPRTRKTVPGIRSETDRRNIVAYLKTLQ